MEHTKRLMTTSPEKDFIYPHEYEQASNAYLMAVVSVIAGLPLPIINVIAALMFYLGHRKSSYFVRWHCIQSIIAQTLVLPFNSIAFAWTISVFANSGVFDHNYHDEVSLIDAFSGASLYYWLYITLIILLNLFEFFAVLYTASRVRNGHNVRWFIVSNITDSLTSKDNRDPYKI